MDLIDASAKFLEIAGRVSAGMGDAISSRELEDRLSRIPTNLGPYGVDPFGFDPQYLKRYLGLGAWVYRKYFRCESFGVQNLPDGPALVIANHSGQLPYDGAMISMATFLDREPPRFLRSMVERFVPSMPFVSPFLARCGQILGTPENCRRLLEAGESILVFPEGVRGLNKTWAHRYQLQRFGQGFMRLAIEAKVPVIPVGVIGAEEQAPTFFNAAKLGKAFGIPALPLTPGLGLVPLPTRYRIHFGEPMHFDGNANDADDVITEKVDLVKARIQALLDDGVAKRDHVFW